MGVYLPFTKNMSTHKITFSNFSLSFLVPQNGFLSLVVVSLLLFFLSWNACPVHRFFLHSWLHWWSLKQFQNAIVDLSLTISLTWKSHFEQWFSCFLTFNPLSVGKHFFIFCDCVHHANFYIFGITWIQFIVSFEWKNIFSLWMQKSSWTQLSWVTWNLSTEPAKQKMLGVVFSSN